MVVLRRNLSCIDPSGRDETLRSKATKITISFSIMSTLCVILTRSLRDLNMLRAIKKQGLYFLSLRAKAIKAFIAVALFRLGGKRAMALEAMSIHLTDLKRKLESGFGLRSNGFWDGLVRNVYLTAVLIDLSMDRKM